MDEWVIATAAALGVDPPRRSERLSGGYINAVFRVAWDSSDAADAKHDRGAAPSAILKITPPYIASSPGVKFSSSRQAREALALALLGEPARHVPQATRHAGLLAGALEGLAVVVPRALAPGAAISLPEEAAAWFSGSECGAAEAVDARALLMTDLGSGPALDRLLLQWQDGGACPAGDGPTLAEACGLLGQLGMAVARIHSGSWRVLGGGRECVLPLPAGPLGPLGPPVTAIAGSSFAPDGKSERPVGPATTATDASAKSAAAAAMAAASAAGSHSVSESDAACLRAELRNADVQALRRVLQYGTVAARLEERAWSSDGDKATAAAIAESMRALGRRFEESEGQCLIMGDLWPASLLVVPAGKPLPSPPRPRTRPTSANGDTVPGPPPQPPGSPCDSPPTPAEPRLGLIDWEFCHWGEVAQDVGHLTAHLLLWAHRGLRARLAADCSHRAPPPQGSPKPATGELPSGEPARERVSLDRLPEEPAFACLGAFAEAWGTELRRQRVAGGRGGESGACVLFGRDELGAALQHAAAEVLARCIGAFVRGGPYEGEPADGAAVAEAIAIAGALWACSQPRSGGAVVVGARLGGVGLPVGVVARVVDALTGVGAAAAEASE